ncbi:four helix bundle protein [Niabella aurantiaca]|uniref:four helix bundle protein n=1 Tax=Niabella aurantiaca TaxID=379900 RepID=UPI0003637CCC|nr:four helix bundle protein [Niabella aurantiaca]
MHNFKELKIWQKSIDVCVDVYKALINFPKDELYGLNTQMKRAAVSVAANISEGAGRNSNKEFLHFLGIANGSSYELQTHIIIANRVMLLTDQITERLLIQVDEIQKMNRGFQVKLLNEL